MRKTLLLSAFMASTLIIAGCVAPGKRPTHVNPAKPNLEMMIFTSQSCKRGVGTEDLGTLLLTAVLKPVITSVIKGAGEKIKEAGEDKVTQVDAREITHFYNIEWMKPGEKETKLHLNTGCITIVYGERTTKAERDAYRNGSTQAFSDEVTALVNATKPKRPAGTALDAATASEILLRKSYEPPAYVEPALGAVASPTLNPDWNFKRDIRFYGQFELTPSQDRTAVQIRPTEILIGKKFADSKIAASGKRDIVLTVGIHPPGVSGVGDAIALPSAALKNVKTNTYLTEEDLDNIATGWFPVAPVPKPTTEAIKQWDQTFVELETVKALITSLAGERDPKLIEKRDAAVILKDKLQKVIDERKPVWEQTAPIVVSSTLTETQEGNKYLVKLGSFISENASSFAEPIANELDPSKQKEAASAEASKSAELRASAIELVDAYRTEDAKVGTERSEAKVKVARIKAIEACRKLEEASLFEVDCLGYADF